MNEIGFNLTKERSKRYPTKTITDTEYADGIVLLANTPSQAKTKLPSQERAAAGINLYFNAHKTEYISFNQRGDISTLNGSTLKVVDKFTYLGSSVSSTETDINTVLAKVRTTIDRLSVIWKSDLTDKLKRIFFQAAVVSILAGWMHTWTLIECMKKKLDRNYTRMLRVILKKSWGQHPIKQQLYGYLPPVTKSIQVRRARHVRHYWWSNNEHKRDVFLWTPSPARTYIQQLCADTICSREDRPKAMDDRDVWQERVSVIRADSETWSWWWWWHFLKNLSVFNSSK